MQVDPDPVCGFTEEEKVDEESQSEFADDILYTDIDHVSGVTEEVEEEEDSQSESADDLSKDRHSLGEYSYGDQSGV